MRQRITAKQENASMCFGCGLENQAGLAASFYELENNELAGIFTPKLQHQGYPGRLHGGIAATILDETMGRLGTIGNKNGWAVTADLHIRYRKPVPLENEIRAVGKIVRRSGRSYETEGRILLADGSTAVEGSGRYVILPIGEIFNGELDKMDWKVVPTGNDPDELEFPEF